MKNSWKQDQERIAKKFGYMGKIGLSDLLMLEEKYDASREKLMLQIGLIARIQLELGEICDEADKYGLREIDRTQKLIENIGLWYREIKEKTRTK